MQPWVKLIVFQLWLLGMLMMCIMCMGAPASSEVGFAFGLSLKFIFMVLVFIWFWQWYVYVQYRHCRQEEFLYLVQTAATMQAPLEQILRAYLNDRPHEHLFRATLLFFVFPGYYWIHINRSFDARLSRLMRMLENGLPLDEALLLVPGLATRETMLAASVGQFSGKLDHAMRRLPENRSAPVWLSVMPRLFYPLLVLIVMMAITGFVMIFIVPKFEKMFLDFKMKLPWITELVIMSSRWLIKYSFVPIFVGLLMVGVVNVWLFSSLVRWHTPLLGRLYRTRVRGEFLQMLGIMLETGKPLPLILECMLDSRLLPGVMQSRVQRLLTEVSQGQPLADALARNQLADGPSQGLIASAERANNLPWALQELGDTLMRRSSRYTLHLALSIFPMLIFVCAALVGLIAVALFSPLTAILEGLANG